MSHDHCPGPSTARSEVRGQGLYLCGPEKADGLEVLHGVSVGGVNTFEEVDLLLEDL